MRFLVLLGCLWIFTAQATTQMVVSNRPIFDMLNQVKTDMLNVHLIAQNSHSHHTELLPKDKLQLNKSDILLAIEPFDSALVKAANQLGKEIIILNDLSSHILPLRISGHDHEEGGDEGHEHDADDPHFWLSPLVIDDIITNLNNRFPNMIDNDKYLIFKEKIDGYSHVLPQNTQPQWVVYHDGWQYLETFFGFDAPLFFTQNPQGLIRPDDFKKAQEQIRQLAVKCIVIEPQTARRIAARVDNLDINVVLLDPTGRTAPKGSNSLYWIWDEYSKAAKSCSD